MNSRSSEGKRGLDPEWYLSPEVFDFEKQNIFETCWVPIGYESQWPEVGSFQRQKILDCECVVVRDKENRIRVFENVCRHRGTQLCHDADGQLNSAFACPYHGWKYDFDGKLISAPNMQNVQGFAWDEFGLKELQCVSWQGFLFAGRSPASSPPAEKLAGVLDCFDLENYQVQQSITYDVAANWKLFFQNYNECYHCPSVHPQLTPYSDYRDSENEFEAGDVLGGPMRIRDVVETISSDGKFCGQPAKTLPESELKNARYLTVFPNLFVSVFPDYVMIHRLTPIDLGRTQIECEFLFHSDTIQSAGFDSRKASEFWDLTNRQDWEMCERVQVGLTTPGFQPSPYSNLESLLVEFDEYYLEQMKRSGYPSLNP